jgi:hypothetical protein
MNIEDWDMKKERLRELLDRFYDGLASREEEEEILAGLNSDIIDEDLVADKEIFLSLHSMSAGNKPVQGFEKRILDGVIRSDRGNRSAGSRKYISAALSAAAALLLAVAVWSLYDEPGQVEYADTFSDAEIAYAETLRVLFMVSADMNRGTGALSPLQTMERAESSISIINESGNLFSKGLREMEKLLNNPGSDNKTWNK